MSLKALLRWLPLVLILAAVSVIVYFRWYEFLSFSQLAEHNAQLQTWAQQHYLWVVLSFMAIYIVVVATSIPGATLLTMTGGFLFGYWLGTLYVIISASIGASIIFVAVKTAFGDYLAKKVTGTIAKLERGFRDNAFNYLLFLRLIPLVPFWVLNIVPGVLGVRLRTFFWATLIGIIPGSFVYVSVGTGLGKIISAGKTPDFGVIFQPGVLLPLLGLAALSLVPIVYHKVKQGHARKSI